MLTPRRFLGLLVGCCLAALTACSQNAGPAAAPAPKRGGAGDPGDARPADGPPLFEDVTAASGVNFTYRNGEDTANHLSILESLGGGVGLIDFDGDGLLDVFLTGGGGFAGKNLQEIVGYACKLYRNLGGGKFEDVTHTAGLDKLAGGRPWFYSHGVAVADYDRDGWPDLLVTGWKGVALLRNVAVDPKNAKAGRRFEDVTAQAGLAAGIDWATSAAFADLDGDGYPDLYLCQYVDWSWQKNPKCNYDGKTPDVCPPRHFDGLPHKLYLNSAGGRRGQETRAERVETRAERVFIDVSREAGLNPGGPNQSKGLGVVIVDLDGDGKPDIYVANDTVDNFLYLNQSKRGQLRFQEVGLTSGAARDDRGAANGSMGVDAGDPERTGKPYLWVTNYENELHALYRNDSSPGRPFFHHRTAALGIAAIGQKYVGWGTGFLDADLDGWEDLFVANGHAIRFPTGKDSNRKQTPLLLHNGAGSGDPRQAPQPRRTRFTDVTSRLGDYAKKSRLARGVALGDLDNDGRTDLVISHMNEPVALLRGVGGKDQHWLGLQLVGKGHACLVGAKVVLEVGGQRSTRFVKGGGSYMSACDQRLHFGMGSATQGKLRVIWPDGSEQHFDNLAVDRYHRVVQGESVAK